jgi:hypothetical protein
MAFRMMSTQKPRMIASKSGRNRNAHPKVVRLLV